MLYDADCEGVVRRVSASWPEDMRDDLRQEARLALLLAPEPDATRSRGEGMAYRLTIARNAMRWAAKVRKHEPERDRPVHEVRDGWREMLDLYPWRDRTVLDLYYRLDMSLVEIGAAMHVSRWLAGYYLRVAHEHVRARGSR